jgi:hypothetical protein
VQPRSSTPSEKDVPSPDVPEREELKSEFLLLGPAPGLNESQHRRSASFRSEMSFQLRRYLIEMEEGRRCGTENVGETEFISQELYVLSQRKERKRSAVSFQSLSSDSVDMVLVALGEEVLAGAGAWDEECESDSYPMAMSGMTQYSSEEHK